MWGWILVGLGWLCCITVLAKAWSRRKADKKSGKKQMTKKKGLVK